jgi:chromatin modification-related protein VID21
MSPHSKDPSSTDLDGHIQATSTRTTRSRARAEEVLHSLPSEKSKASSSEKTSGAHHTYTPSPLRDIKPENMTIDTDEENDELDLIGSAFSEEGKREARQEASKVIRRKVEASMSIDTLSAPESSTNAGAPLDELGVASKRLGRTTEEMDVDDQKYPSKRQELIRDKDESIDAEEVEAITKPSDAEAADHASTVEDKMDVSATSVTAAVVPDDVPSQQAQVSPLPPTSSVASPLQATPVGIQQATPVQIPSQADDKLPQLGVSEPVAQKTEPTSRIDNYRFNPTYTLPPLSVLPADFTKKAKPIKRKKDKDRDKEREKERESKRDKDDNVPMGLSRWAATLMANPLWRKVSRANKTLSTHDWSVRIFVFVDPLSLAELCLSGCDD